MRRLLVCLDASPRAALVLDAAVDLARRCGAKLTLFRGVGLQPDLPPEAYATSPNELMELLVARARDELTRLATRVPADLLEGVYAHVGVPWQAICDAAVERDADVIVIGSHGYSGIDKLIGTTAAKVVNHSDRSVYVVRSRG